MVLCVLYYHVGIFLFNNQKNSIEGYHWENDHWVQSLETEKSSAFAKFLSENIMDFVLFACNASFWALELQATFSISAFMWATNVCRFLLLFPVKLCHLQNDNWEDSEDHLCILKIGEGSIIEPWGSTLNREQCARITTTYELFKIIER